jgi:hypothetical protein
MQSSDVAIRPVIHPIKSTAMKDTNHKKEDPGQKFTVEATIHKPRLLHAIIRELASKLTESRYSRDHQEKGWRTFNSSSPETYVSGKVVVSSNGENIPIAFDTCFLFTCIRTSKSVCRPEWGISLS